MGYFAVPPVCYFPDGNIGFFKPLGRQGHDFPPLPVNGKGLDMVMLHVVHDFLDHNTESIQGEAMLVFFLEAIIAIGIAPKSRKQDERKGRFLHDRFSPLGESNEERSALSSSAASLSL